MILLTRLNGSQFSLNAFLIETVEETPDTVITLVNGKRYIVRESMAEVVERVRAFLKEVRVGKVL
ncbi:flagellar FlbD family protein [Calditerricola satsumensis]|uniref:Flagellar FlbD family protein n=1 Tax=Calditerricola satsumensis TaxID=373054 RepID=A0A8J3B6R5_9BACI|nr:flagellar FlbD family protein [Calditerricola satsumensis]GGJ97886.1 flagellar FlbD family protein [Calditerricola satsumensis]